MCIRDSFDTLPGCAKRTVQLMKEAGIVLTGAGATYPYGKDPEAKNIRIAPTLPPVNEIEIAAEAMCICVKPVSYTHLDVYKRQTQNELCRL